MVDIIRPFSEKRGLRADLIRLQREEVAIAIAFKATERLRITGDTPHSIPNKILVPMLEKASLEDPNSELIDRWANLLASTARCPHIKAITFADVLSQLGGDQAQLLDRIGVPRWKVVPEPLLSSTMGVVRGSNWLDRIYTRGIPRLDGFGKHISLLLVQQEIDESELCYTVELRVVGPAGYTEVDRYYRDNKIDFDILERQSLIEKHHFETNGFFGNIGVTIYGLTELGIEFLYSIGSHTESGILD